jgi:hypothetical protein
MEDKDKGREQESEASTSTVMGRERANIVGIRVYGRTRSGRKASWINTANRDNQEI